MRIPTTIAILFFAVAIFALRGGHSGSATSAEVWGDANCDTQIASADGLHILRLAGGLQVTGASCASDVDCSGEVDPIDALRIFAYLAGISWPAPGGCPEIGSVVGGQTPPPAPTETASPANVLTPTPTPTPAASPSPDVTPTSTATPALTATPTPSVTSSAECTTFPADNWWNTDISGYPVHANSDAIISAIGADEYMHPDFGTVWAGSPIGIPYVTVAPSQQKVPVNFYYGDESDPGPYPIPSDVPVEGQPVGQPNSGSFGGDRHVIVLDETACILYELYDAHPVSSGQSWDAGSGAIFDLTSNNLRPDYWTSADAAGLPIYPGLVRYDEVVEDGVIDHALRFTVSQTRQAFIHPATHWASSNTSADLPPMGMRFRMKASYDCSWASNEVQVICTALKTYGMFVADNGADWYLSGAPDSRWDDDRLGDLKDVPGSAFEVVETGEPVVTP